MRANKIYLVGFMGSGKTTVGRELARRLDWRMEDIDSLIEAHEQRDIAAIFRTAGETHFRAVERAMLQRLVPLRDTVVATGGGTFVENDNRELINRDGASIWLDLPFSRVVERIPSDRRRPLASDRDELARLFETRRVAYADAHFRVDADRPIGELVERIIDMLRA